MVGVSPLTHLAVAGGNDLLRNDWFYQPLDPVRADLRLPPPWPLAALGLCHVGGLLLALLLRVAPPAPNSTLEKPE